MESAGAPQLRVWEMGYAGTSAVCSAEAAAQSVRVGAIQAPGSPSQMRSN